MDSDQISSEELQRLAEASLWRVRLMEQGVRSEEFEAWLVADDRNAMVWGKVANTWDSFDDFATLPEMIEARRIALNHAQAHHRLSFAVGKLTKRMKVVACVAATVLLFIGWGAFSWLLNSTVYETARGERRVISLEDGSKLSLDSRSRVQVRYSANKRHLTLLQGQARFDVAHDVTRPFVVTAQSKNVVATGTAFNIDVSATELRVTLLSGKALVLPKTEDLSSQRKPETPELRAGQQYVAVLAEAPMVKDVNLNAVTAWELGQLIFDDERLETVVARVSKYTDVPLRIADPTIADMRISGVFKAGDAADFVDALTHYLPVTALNAGNGEIRLLSR